MAKQILFEKESKSSLLEGVRLISRTVGSTLGPGGRNVIFQKENGYKKPVITKDGVSVAREFSLPNSQENLGCEIVKAACEKQLKDVGDGTTTTAVMTYHIFNEANGFLNGEKFIDKKLNPIRIKREIDRLTEKVVIPFLKSKKKSCKKVEELFDVAFISSNGDKEIAKLVSEAVHNSGEFGAIVTNSRATEFSMESVKSFTNDKGFLNNSMFPAIAKNKTLKCNKQKGEVVEKNANIILIADKVDRFGIIQNMLEYHNTNYKDIPLIVLAEEFDETVEDIFTNNLGLGFGFIPVRLPSYGPHVKDFLSDLAITTGAKVVNSVNELENEEILGCSFDEFFTPVDSVIIGHGYSYIHPKESNQDIKAIAEHVELIQGAMEKSTTSLMDKKTYGDRISNIKGRTSIINFYGQTETEEKEIGDRIDDAKCATLSAYKEGVIAGGGYSLLHCMKLIQELEDESLSDNELVAMHSLVAGLCGPVSTILKNLGHDYTDIQGALTRLNETAGYPIGYDVDDYNLENKINYIEKGIVDPLLVTINALRNSVSLAGSLLTTSASMTNI